MATQMSKRTQAYRMNEKARKRIHTITAKCDGYKTATGLDIWLVWQRQGKIHIHQAASKTLVSALNISTLGHRSNDAVMQDHLDQIRADAQVDIETAKQELQRDKDRHAHVVRDWEAQKVEMLKWVKERERVLALSQAETAQREIRLLDEYKKFKASTARAADHERHSGEVETVVPSVEN